MAIDAAQMAGGMPQNPQTQVSPGQVSTADPAKILEALKAAVQQAVDQQGYVDLNKLVMTWPMISQQFGINIPFQTVMQLIEQNPQLIEDMVVQMGLAGIIQNGQKMSAQQLLGQGTGAV